MLDNKPANKDLAGFSNFRHSCLVLNDVLRHVSVATTADVFGTVVVTVKMDWKHGLHAGHVDLARRASPSAEVTPVSDSDHEPTQYDHAEISSSAQSNGVFTATAKLLGIRKRLETVQFR